MPRNNNNFSYNLFAALRKALPPYYHLESYFPLANTILTCVNKLDEALEYRPVKDVLFSKGIAHTRIDNLSVSSHQSGLYKVLIDPPSYKERQFSSPPGSPVYHGTDRGSSKSYKRGGVVFEIIETLGYNESLRLENIYPILKLSQSSKSHGAVMSSKHKSSEVFSQLSSSRSPTFRSPNIQSTKSFPQIFSESDTFGTSESSEFSSVSSVLKAQGFDTQISSLHAKMNKEGNALTRKIYTQDYGIPITTSEFASRITSADYPKIVQAILEAGLKNPPVFLPYDFKPEHILMQIENDQKSFFVIDFHGIAVTPVFLSKWAQSYLQIPLRFVFGFFQEASTNPQELLNKANIPTLQDKIFCIVADTITSTFAALAAFELLAKHNLEDLKNPEILNSIVTVALAKIRDIPSLFASGPPGFSEMLQTSLNAANEAHLWHMSASKESPHADSRDWARIFWISYKDSLWKT